MSVPEAVKLSELVSPRALDASQAYAPPPRFAAATFSNYRPTHPSQEQAVRRLEQLLASLQPARNQRGLFRLLQKQKPAGSGLYLDGGFGVGKTHLLAAAYHAADTDLKAFMSFQELVYRVGVRGIAAAAEDFRGLRLLLLDEFELDDPGNTLIVKSVLQSLFAQGTRVVTTSNTPATAQGEGRFNASDFAREIQGIAAHFDSLRLDGPDYRVRSSAGPVPHIPGCADPAEGGKPPVVTASWPELLAVLRDLHPMAYGPLLAQVGTLYLNGVDTIPNQNDALRFVHFIDRLYDLRVSLRFGVQPHLAADLRALFAAGYRDGAYQKKHDRCVSRLIELHGESAASEPVLSAA